ncbi:hypothetical protein BS47DRAFT_482443 [Hydnum rufescens UP504]|uniref:Uncharacterized protein n=1 Tax=Hydnum rufescens UP504 TaxID=1448309 RepID=A0A9P6AIH8_9AGAM|nr:hypothetical protein BS47DRAFT_482443 [Hydnum rufescens UP504]
MAPKPKMALILPQLHVLKALEDHLNRWKSLDWIEEQIRLPDESSESAELVGGILACSNLSTITCIELPSRIRQTPLRTWIHQNDFEIISFTIDPSQDLLTLVEILNSNATLSLNVHLRTLSGNTPHPRVSDITHPTYIPKNQTRLLSDGDAYRFSVMGDSIALLDDDQRTVSIWNWCTGTLIY